MQQLSSLSNKELWNTMMASAIKSNSPRQFTATYSLLCGEARGGRGGGERRGDGKRGVFKCLARGKIRQRLDLRPLNEESNLLNIWTPWLLRKIIFNEQWKVYLFCVTLSHFKYAQIIVGFGVIVVRCQSEPETLVGKLNVTNTLKPKSTVR